MSPKGLGRRLRLSTEVETGLKNKLAEAGRKGDVSPFVEEICRFYINNELVRIRPDMVKRLLEKHAELKRREDLGPFVEWICELFLDNRGTKEDEEIVFEAGFTDTEKAKKNEQRKAS